MYQSPFLKVQSAGLHGCTQQINIYSNPTIETVLKSVQS